MRVRVRVGRGGWRRRSWEVVDESDRQLAIIIRGAAHAIGIGAEPAAATRGERSSPHFCTAGSYGYVFALRVVAAAEPLTSKA